ncbi:hypothetical protein ACFLQ8_00040 [Candidatus Auribacterota bacterium]
MKRIVGSLIMVVGLVYLSGCAVALIGAGAMAGYSLSKDSIEGYADVSHDSLWNKCIEVVKKEGVVKLEDKGRGKFEGTVDEINITGQLTQVSDSTAKLRISGRNRFLMPNVTVPQRLFIRIFEELGVKVKEAS